MTWLLSKLIRAHRSFFGDRREAERRARNFEYTREAVQKIVEQAMCRNSRNGAALYMWLPDEVANVVTMHYFDPYHLHLSRQEIWEWIGAHILFDKDGRVEVLHDYGKVIWKRDKEN